MNNMIFCNGQFIPSTQPTILASDCGFLFGEGIFTTIRVSNGRIEFFKEHCERFARHCRALKIIPPQIELSHLIKLIELNGAETGIWRLKIIATAKTRSAKLRSVGSHVMLIEPYLEAKNENYTLMTYPEPVSTPLSYLKTLQCASRFFLLDEAARKGFTDVLLTSPEGYVTETAFANFFWRQGNDVFTPSTSLPLMPGIALKHAEIAAKTIQCNWHDVKIKPHEIPPNAQLFVCNSLKGIVPVTRYDTAIFARDHSFEKALLNSFNKLVTLHSTVIIGQTR